MSAVSICTTHHFYRQHRPLVCAASADFPDAHVLSRNLS
ncbi:hypothetical protein APHWI1_0105 [Anaplasma phagocytophilum str. ApWI1]|uniref:Uncharacterized protein n=2 Tax=Anaplasma phagocytophilum TaxID=948 RepID=A0A0F3NEI0_ANAPH|nr:hypothetical protein APHWEB_1406 [Anaplasma phagocytophilum str. Webster]KJV65329.1 hypothetical protein EPHNCH_0914 [Anaplasma phagocytophilum str. NCH-1]KJV82236.1 hypothetical protein APHHGE2_0903 [Anaplasma phagocytophilum str. HGE2]KJV84224.1 hypothetical protein APHWI1_0105 [Anaplasma phagocytophilum str. ApWI1]KJV86549.1 hypothetical protein APHNYW_1374 [Anaplasma phagocytophilum str. ApNYW]KJV98730.1 hypothetical protein OTSANNIE_0873 [Anaplasma phagocytophilum str. Annie]